MKVSGSTALLTGAAGGLGAALAEELGRRGARLVLSGRNVDGLRTVAERIRSSGGTAEVVSADLSDPAAPARLVADAEALVGPVDLLVNNAGVETTSAFTRLEPNEIEQMVRVNLTSPMQLTHALLPGMLERGRGHVANIASLAGKGPNPYGVPYAATKAGLIAMTRSLRAELTDAPVRFSVVCPGFIGEAGMYARMEPHVGKAPRTFGVSPMSRVVAATVRAIERDRGEVIVNPMPMRPMLAIGELAPSLGERLVEVGGVRRYFGRVAQYRGRA